MKQSECEPEFYLCMQRGGSPCVGVWNGLKLWIGDEQHATIKRATEVGWDLYPVTLAAMSKATSTSKIYGGWTLHELFEELGNKWTEPVELKPSPPVDPESPLIPVVFGDGAY